MGHAESDAIVLANRSQQWRVGRGVAGRQGTPCVSRPPEWRDQNRSEEVRWFPATQKIIRLAETSQPPYGLCFGVALSVSPRRKRAASIRWPHILEATMELVVRLNVLAALLSFGFIAAIVFGVV